MKDEKKKKHAKEQQIEKVNKHFIKTPEKPRFLIQQICILAGIVLLVFGFSSRNNPTGVGISVVGLIITLAGIFSYSSKNSLYKKLYKIAEPKYSDAEMDSLLAAGMQLVLLEARERLDIDSDDTRSKPLIIDGPEANTVLGYGKDKTLRFRYHNILVFFLTDHNIASFQCTLDLGCSEILRDKTKEFPYKDITNLETETNNEFFYYLDNKKQNVEGIKKLSLYTSGGNTTSINYIFSKDTVNPDGYKLPPSNAENTIKAIRKKLKEYKDKFSTS